MRGPTRPCRQRGFGVVHARLPAGRTQKLGIAAGHGEAVIVVGVPGELSRLRLRPRPPCQADGWEVVVLQANQPTRTVAGGPHASLDAGQVQFGVDGAVAVVVRALGATGGGCRLRTTSRLPVGYLHPQVLATELPAGPGAPHGLTMLSVATRLREGLDLRVRQWFPQNVDGITGEYVEFSPEWIVTPPTNLATPYALDFDVPGFPWPPTSLDAFEGYAYAHVEYATEKAWLDRITARVRRHPPPKPGFGGGVPDLAPPNHWNLHLDALEVLPGEHVALTLDLPPTNCTQAPVLAPLRVWLTSPHGYGIWSSILGVDLTGPLEVPLSSDWTAWSPSFDLPDQLAPGLYTVQVRLGAPGDLNPCGVQLLMGPDRVPLRVLEP